MIAKIPMNIRWSAATAAFQIEGSRSADGRIRSIWDDFADTPGAVLDGSTADPGPDSYNRFKEDADLAKGLGLDRYRFSLSWVRLIDEAGKKNQKGFDYYSRVIDELLTADVTPFPTLYHWDLPAHLEAKDGWLNRDTALRFAEYVDAAAEAFGDRVKHWYTLNEPAMTTLQGYAVGTLAPGRQELFGALPSIHYQLLAHGLALPILRAAGASEVGLTKITRSCCHSTKQRLISPQLLCMTHFTTDSLQTRFYSVNTPI